LRVLLVNQFYPPDMAPTGQHLHDLARALVARGHAVTAVCSRRSYDGGGEYAAAETIDGVEVRRLRVFGFGRRGAGRAADYLSFHAALLGGSWDRRRFDVAVGLTTPPYVGWTLRRSPGLRARRHVSWVMDVYPDALLAHGALRPSSLAYRLLRLVARRQMARTDLAIALGPRMAQRVRAHATGRTRVEWVAPWGTADVRGLDSAAVRAVRSSRGWSADDCVLLYSGNMGLGHRLGEFLAAARRLGARGPLWAFAGGGVRRCEVEAFLAGAERGRVELLPYVPQSAVGSSLAAAEVHLVSLRDEWKGLIVPSKLQAAFALARPVIFVGPRDCEPADWITESGGGWVVGEDDVEALVRAVGEAQDAPERLRRGQAALAYSVAHFDRARNADRVAELVEAVS
jgi:colanic acid biosynthesis glycosyl transferase WcaI